MDDDGLGCFRGLLWAIPIGVVFWIIVWWAI